MTSVQTAGRVWIMYWMRWSPLHRLPRGHRVRRAVAVALGVPAVLLGVPSVVAGEVVRPTAGDGVATCLRATGPDGLALVGPRTEGGYATEFLAVSAATAQTAGAVTLGHLDECAAVTAADGGEVVAGTVRSGRQPRVVAALRDRGGRFGAPVVLGRARADKIVTAMSPRGDAAVLWTERRTPSDQPDGSETRLLLALRRPGGRLGAPRQVFGWSTPDTARTTALAAAFDAGGTLTLAWGRPRPAHGPIGDLSDVEAASIGPGASLGATQLLARDRQEVRHIALAVAPNGGALLGFFSTGRVEVFERAPATTAFVAGGTFGDSGANTEDLPTDVAVALDDGGAAVVGWRDDAFHGHQPRPADVVRARTRGAGEAFGTVQVVDAEATDGGRGRGFLAVISGDGPPIDDLDGPGLQVAVSADGRAALAWTRGGPGGPQEARGATIARDGAVAVRRLGTPCRRASGVAALLVDGVPAIAFTDNRDTPFGDVPLGGGVLHVVGADELVAPRTRSSAPTARVRLGAARRLRYGQKLAVPVRCDRDCDILVQAARSQDFPWGIAAGASARAGVTRRVVLDPGSDTLVSPHAHGVRMRVTACALDGTSSTAITVVQPAVQVPPRPGPVLRDVQARRSGRNIVVTWSIVRPLRHISFTVFGSAAVPNDTDQPAVANVPGQLRTHFRVVLRPERPRTVTEVVVAGRTDEPPYRGGVRRVRVR